jgi:hypothetical protein
MVHVVSNIDAMCYLFGQLHNLITWPDRVYARSSIKIQFQNRAELRTDRTNMQQSHS